MEIQPHPPEGDVEAFYRYVLEHPQGVTNEDLKKAGWTDQNQILNAANLLLGQGRMELTQVGGNRLLYQAVDPNSAAKLRNLDPHHLLVLQLIEKAGNKGAWSKFLKDQSQLQQHTITRVTKELMRRQLIKEVKSVQNRNRKVFMLWDVEPAREVSGGTWYHDGEFAANWIETLRQLCQEFLESHNGRAVTLQDIHDFVLEKPQGPSVPQEEDVASIMRTLELDEEVYSVQTATGQMVYTKRNRFSAGQPFDVFTSRVPSYMLAPNPGFSGLVVPCLSCPLADECQVGGRIGPERCEYFANWLRGKSNDTDSRNVPLADATMHDW